MSEKAEYESVTLKVPKEVMEYLRRMYNNPVEWIEHDVVDSVRADVDSMDTDKMVDIFNLRTVFQTVLNDC